MDIAGLLRAQADALEAQARVLRAQAEALAVAGTAPAIGPAYYDGRSAPMGRRGFLRLTANGVIPSYKIGRRVVAQREDVDAWIRAQRRDVEPRVANDASASADPFDRALAAGRLRRGR